MPLTLSSKADRLLFVPGLMEVELVEQVKEVLEFLYQQHCRRLGIKYLYNSIHKPTEYLLLDPLTKFDARVGVKLNPKQEGALKQWAFLLCDDAVPLTTTEPVTKDVVATLWFNKTGECNTQVTCSKTVCASKNADTFNPFSHPPSLL